MSCNETISEVMLHHISTRHEAFNQSGKDVYSHLLSHTPATFERLEALAETLSLVETFRTLVVG